MNKKSGILLTPNLGKNRADYEQAYSDARELAGTTGTVLFHPAYLVLKDPVWGCIGGNNDQYSAVGRYKSEVTTTIAYRGSGGGRHYHKPLTIKSAFAPAAERDNHAHRSRVLGPAI